MPCQSIPVNGKLLAGCGKKKPSGEPGTPVSQGKEIRAGEVYGSTVRFRLPDKRRGTLSGLENIDIVPLYLAAERPVLERDGMLMMIDDNRIDLQPGEVIKKRMVRFRTLGCWPLTGAVESNAQTLPEIIEEMLVSTTSERQGRVIDRDQAGSMELKKRQGYF